jgi:translation initiation factor IF-2
MSKITRNAKIKLFVMVLLPELSALKRFKDDVKVAKGYDCGIQIKGYNVEGDVIEAYHVSN